MDGTTQRAAIIKTSKPIETENVYADPETNYGVVTQAKATTEMLNKIKEKEGVRTASFIRSASRKKIVGFLLENNVEVNSAVYITPTGKVEAETLEPVKEDVSKVTIQELVFTINGTEIELKHIIQFTVNSSDRDVLTGTVLPGFFGVVNF